MGHWKCASIKFHLPLRARCHEGACIHSHQLSGHPCTRGFQKTFVCLFHFLADTGFRWIMRWESDDLKGPLAKELPAAIREVMESHCFSSSSNATDFWQARARIRMGWGLGVTSHMRAYGEDTGRGWEGLDA